MSAEEIIQNIKSGAFELAPRRKTKSAIWSLFSEIKKEDGCFMDGFVYCRSCRRVLKYNGKQTSNLVRHKCYTTTSGKVPAKQVDLEDKKDAVIVCSQWVIEDCKPFSSVDGSGFLKMVKFFIKIGAKYGENVDASDLIPQSSTISGRINSLAQEKKTEIKSDLKEKVNQGKASVTMNLWTDNYVKRNFMCTTLHFYNKPEMKEIVLGIKSMDFERSSSENIHKKLLSIFADFDIHNLNKLTFVTDRDTEVKSALNDYTRINCNNHLFTNVLDTAFGSTNDLKPIIESCRKLIKYFKKFNLQHILSTSLGAQCCIRWNSHLNMFKSIFDNWLQINEILTDKNELNRITSIDCNLLSSLVELCTDFDTVSKKLQTSSSPSICFVIPSISRLKKICQPTEQDVPAISTLKSNIVKEIDFKWIPNLSVHHKIAFFLYPPANNMQEQDLTEVKEMCITQMLTWQSDFSENQNISTPPIPTSLASAPVSRELQFFFPDLLKGSVTAQPESARDEVERYCRNRIPMDMNFDPMRWWENHQKEYPKLAKVALNILSIPASSAASERVFSLAGNIIVEKRNQLGSQTVDNIIFLNSFNKF